MNISVKKRQPLAISLIQLPLWGTYEPSIALAQIAGCLKRDNFAVSVFDINIELFAKRHPEFKSSWDNERSGFWIDPENIRIFFAAHEEEVNALIARIAAGNPDLAGFSVNAYSLLSTLEFAKRLKEAVPEIKIVLGGQMFLVPSDISGIIGKDFIDFIVYGEGEVTICELAGCLSRKEDAGNCQGLYYKKDGAVVKTPQRPPISDLDDLPFLDLGAFPVDKYEPPEYPGKHISLMASRGCVSNCVYCGPRGYWQGFRSMSGKRVYDEIEYQIEKKPDIEHVEFLNFEFNGSLKSLEDFCDLVIDKPFNVKLGWDANIMIRPEMGKDLFRKMKLAGCSHLSIGIETGSQRILDLMRRKYNIDDAVDLLRIIHQEGIPVSTNFMFGFPGETDSDFELTIDFLKRNAALLGTVYPSRSFFNIEPFSYVAKHPQEFGISIDQDNSLYWESLAGGNDYPKRLERYELFVETAIGLGVAIEGGLKQDLLLNRYYNLGQYYYAKKDAEKAVYNFSEYFKIDGSNVIVNKKLRELRDK